MKKKILSFFIFNFLFFSNFCFGEVLMVHEAAEAMTNDVPGWLAAIDQIYNQYDQIAHAITQIEQQYQQMIFYIERAKNFNWKTIQWDGDLDFRDEITQATRQVNRQLTNIRKIESNFSSQKITMNGKNFSLKDLCGLGKDETKSLSSFLNEALVSTKNTFETAGDQFVNGISAEEGARIYAKYGLSPRNYWMVQTAKQKVAAAIRPVLAEAEEDTLHLKNDERNQAIENIMNMIEENSDTGELTELQMAQLNAGMQKLTIEQLQSLQYDLNKSSAAYMYYIMQQQTENDLKEQNEKENMMNLVNENRSLPSDF